MLEVRCPNCGSEDLEGQTPPGKLVVLLRCLSCGHESTREPRVDARCLRCGTDSVRAAAPDYWKESSDGKVFRVPGAVSSRWCPTCKRDALC